MNKILESKIKGIQEVLMAIFNSSSKMGNEVKGSEREILVKEFFEHIFPTPYKFGTGEIIDSDGYKSGQLDVVIEFPFLPSFPNPGSNQRLYLADSVAAVIEVKSTLGNLDKLINQSKKVSVLSRNWNLHKSMDQEGKFSDYHKTNSFIPYLIVAYKGSIPKDWFNHFKKQVHGILIIKTGKYTGCSFNGFKYKGEREDGLLGFCFDLAWMMSNVLYASPNLSAYFKIKEAKVK